MILVLVVTSWIPKLVSMQTRKKDATYARYWQYIRNWRTSGNEQLYGFSPFDSDGRKWLVPKTGYYFCSAAVRLDSFTHGQHARLMISIDGSTNAETGMSTTSGNRGSYNYRFMNVAGTIKLEKDQTVEVLVYASGDNSWTFRTESGFSCHALGAAQSSTIANFEKQINNGFSVIDGNGGSTNQRNMGASGVVKIDKGQEVGVFLYSHSDASWQVNTESGFSCHKLTAKAGFHADKDGDSDLGSNWQELQKWRVAGFPTLYDDLGYGDSFDRDAGRFRVSNEGAFYCYAQVRLDDANTGLKRLILARNGETDTQNGFHTIGGNRGSTDYRSMRVAGNAWIRKDETVSIFVYSSSDSYVAHSESGFGCHRLSSEIGFHSDMSESQTFGRNWRRVSKWRAGGNSFLYQQGGGFSPDGYYFAPQDGYYICSAMMKLTSGSTSYRFSLLLTVDDNKDYHNGLHATNGYGSSDQRPLVVAGSIYLKEKQKVAVWMFSQSDNSYALDSESGFGCHLFETYNDC